MKPEILKGFVMMIVLVGMVLGVGILTLDKLGVAAKDSTTVTYETIAIAAGTGTTANDDVTSVSWFGNNSVNSSSTTITIGNNVANVDINWTSDGVIVVNSTLYTAGNYNISYVYDADTSTTESTDDTSAELGTIASTWIGLIITILVLAIIIVLVIRSFGNYR